MTEIGSSAYTMNFGTVKEREAWLKEISNKSDFTANAMTISSKDRIITLSTCAYDFQNARYVVHGKLSAVNKCLKERYLTKCYKRFLENRDKKAPQHEILLRSKILSGFTMLVRILPVPVFPASRLAVPFYQEQTAEKVHLMLMRNQINRYFP